MQGSRNRVGRRSGYNCAVTPTPEDVPVADAIEQNAEVLDHPADDEDAVEGTAEIGIDVPEADALEQAAEVAEDGDDERR